MLVPRKWKMIVPFVSFPTPPNPLRPWLGLVCRQAL